MQEQEPWVSMDEVAKHPGIAKDTVYCWIDKEALPAHRVVWPCKLELSQVTA